MTNSLNDSPAGVDGFLGINCRIHDFYEHLGIVSKQQDKTNRLKYFEWTENHVKRYGED